jgi:hypothetical protein
VLPARRKRLLPHREGVSALAGELDPNRLCLCVLVDGFEPILATEATHLIAAERSVERERAIGVDPDRPRANGVGHPVRPLDVLRPDTGGKAVIRVVGLANQLLLVLERDDREDGPKISSRAICIPFLTCPRRRGSTRRLSASCTHGPRLRPDVGSHPLTRNHLPQSFVPISGLCTYKSSMSTGGCTQASRCGSLSSFESWSGILGIVRHRPTMRFSRCCVCWYRCRSSSYSAASDTAESCGSQREWWSGGRAVSWCFPHVLHPVSRVFQ